MTTSRQKAIGSNAERDVAHRLHGYRVPGYGPIDVETPLPNPQVLQVKRLTALPSLNAMRVMLENMPYQETRLRGVVIYDRAPGTTRVRRSILFDMDEYAEWYGPVEE